VNSTATLQPLPAEAVLSRYGINTHRIAPKLYQGALPPEGRVLHDVGFQVLVLCAEEHQNGHYDGLIVVRCPMDDDGETLRDGDWSRARAAAAMVAPYLRRGMRTLVTCRQGWNRSGLVTAMLLNRVMGWPGDQCVAHVRRARPGGLSNLAFAKALRSRLP